MSASKPQPLMMRAAPKRCPVCGASSYSRGGIHPQCASHQLDNERMQLVRAEQKRVEEQSLSIPAPV